MCLVNASCVAPSASNSTPIQYSSFIYAKPQMQGGTYLLESWQKVNNDAD